MTKSRTVVRLDRRQHRLLEDWCKDSYVRFKDDQLTFERIADLATEQLAGKLPKGLNRDHVKSAFDTLGLAPCSRQGVSKLRARKVALLVDRVELQRRVIEDLAKQLGLSLPMEWKEVFED